MSKNSNENQLNSRLKNIFNDLDQPKEFPGLRSLSDLTGWIWEMDPEGIISGCSPEIEVFLETPIQSLIGKTLESFSDFSFGSANLPADPHRAMMPTMLEINFQHTDGTLIPTLTYILGKLGEDNELLSWRGITSIQIPEPAPEAEPEAPKKVSAEPFSSLVSLDIVPEIPQPDLSVSDIWRESSLDTAPLSQEDLLEEGRAFASSLGKESESASDDQVETAPQDEIETISIPRKTEQKDTVDHPAEDLPEAVISEADAPIIHSLSEDVQTGALPDIFGEETPEWATDPTPNDVEDIQAEDFPSEPLITSPQDEIETIRYRIAPNEPTINDEITDDLLAEILDPTDPQFADLEGEEMIESIELVEHEEEDELDEDYETGELFPISADAFGPIDQRSDPDSDSDFPGLPFEDPAPEAEPSADTMRSGLSDSSGTWIPEISVPFEEPMSDPFQPGPSEDGFTPDQVPDFMEKTEPLTAGTDVPTRPMKPEEFPEWVTEEAEDNEKTEEPADTRDLDPTTVAAETSEIETVDGDTGPLPTPVIAPRVELPICSPTWIFPKKVCRNQKMKSTILHWKRALVRLLLRLSAAQRLTPPS